jgi:hypothetical protein
MPRSQANLQFTIFEGLSGLSLEAKIVYFALLVEPTLNQAGMCALRPNLWARQVELPITETEKALLELDEKRFAFVDSHTEEVLVRTLIRNDGVATRPNVLQSACSAAVLVRSPRLRRELASELRKLPPKAADKVNAKGLIFTYPDPHQAADKIDPPTPTEPSTASTERPEGTVVEPFENPSTTVREPFDEEPFENPSRTLPKNPSRTLVEPFPNPSKGLVAEAGAGNPSRRDSGSGSTSTTTYQQKPSEISTWVCAKKFAPIPKQRDERVGEPANKPANEAGSRASAGSRGTRLPADFRVTEALTDWARANTPNVDLGYETEQFRDYWHAKSRDADRRDWIATWRRWMRKAEKDLAERRARPVTRVPAARIPTTTARVAAIEALRHSGAAS